MNGEELTKHLREYFNTPQGRKQLEDDLRDLEFRSNIDLKYCSKFHKLSKEERRNIIKKIINKYSSKEYKDREYFRCKVMPRETLYYLLFDYGAKYGEEYIDDDIGFPYDAYKFDENIVIEVIHGQGSICKIFFLDE